MPLYEYECSKCGDRFEQIQKFSDPPVKKHDGCGGKVRRLLSAPAIQFKGSGWYITDYARGGKPDGSADKKAEEKADKKTEVKSEAKSESKDTGKSDSKASNPAKTSDSSKK